MSKKKSMKEAATAGTSVFDQIAAGNAIDVKDVKNVTNVRNVKKAQDAPAAKQGRPATYTQPLERLNLKIPAEYKEYLTIAAAKESIAQRRSISLTQYLCDLIEADRKRHKGQDL